MSEKTVEEAFRDHKDAQRIREAIAYVRVWTTVGDDEMLQWADEEVMDAAGKYADYLETRAYLGKQVARDPLSGTHDDGWDS